MVLFFFHTDILLHFAFGIFDSEHEWTLSCFRRMPQNAEYFTSFYVTIKYPLPLKIDQHKDGCHLKTHFGGRQVWLSLILNRVFVCSVNIHDACYNLFLQHVDNMTLSSLMMTPYNTQVRVILTLNIIQL